MWTEGLRRLIFTLLPDSLLEYFCYAWNLLLHGYTYSYRDQVVPYSVCANFLQRLRTWRLRSAECSQGHSEDSPNSLSILRMVCPLPRLSNLDSGYNFICPSVSHIVHSLVSSHSVFISEFADTIPPNSPCISLFCSPWKFTLTTRRSSHCMALCSTT